MEKQKRIAKSYKCTNRAYKKAVCRAKHLKDKITLAEIVEQWVIEYGETGLLQGSVIRGVLKKREDKKNKQGTKKTKK